MSLYDFAHTNIFLCLGRALIIKIIEAGMKHYFRKGFRIRRYIQQIILLSIYINTFTIYHLCYKI